MSPRRVFICLGLALLPALGVTSCLRQFRSAFSQDYNRLPPEGAFKRALGRPVPSGVSEIRATGDGSISGTSLWVRFRATPAAIDALTAAARPASPDWVTQGWGEQPGSRYLEGLARIRWSEARQVRKPVAYELAGLTGGSARALVDREKGEVFVLYIGT